MLVNILVTFTTENRTYRRGENLDVPREQAAKWVADGYAAYDTDGQIDAVARVSRSNQLVTADGQVVGGGVLRAAGMAAVRPFSAAPTLATVTSTNTWRQVFKLPKPGRVLVRAVYETDQATPAARTASFSVADTFGADARVGGAFQSWQVASALTPPTPGTITTMADWSVGRTDWFLLDAPEATDGGGGYVLLNTKYAASDRTIVGTTARPQDEWVEHTNALLPFGRYASFYASGDFASANQNDFVPALAKGGQICPAYLEYIPADQVFWGVAIGNSTTGGLGEGDPLVQPNNYGWPLIAANDRVAAGRPVVISNFAHEGQAQEVFGGTPETTGRLSLLFKSADFRPSFVVLQPTSSNSGVISPTVDSSMRNTLLWCKKMRELGILPIIRTMHPTEGVLPERETARQSLNAAIRASGELYFDLDACVRDPLNPSSTLAAYRRDTTHLNRAGNEAAARDPVHGFAQLLARIGA